MSNPYLPDDVTQDMIDRYHGDDEPPQEEPEDEEPHRTFDQVVPGHPAFIGPVTPAGWCPF